MLDEARKAVRESIKGYEPRRVDVFEAWALDEVCIGGANCKVDARI